MPLADVVAGQIGNGEHAVHRAHVDDAARTLAGHFTCHRLAHEKGALDVHTQHGVEIVLFDIEKVRHLEDAGIVDQHIDAAELLHDAGDKSVHLLLVAHIAVQVGGAQAGCAFLAFLIVHVRDDDMGLLRGKPLGACGANALGSARDDADPATQSEVDGILVHGVHPHKASEVA